MSSLQQGSLNFNRSFSFNFKGGNLSSDSGLLLVRSFVEKLGLRPLLQDFFKDSIDRRHTHASIIEQLVYTTITGYKSDNASDHLRHDPVFTGILDKESLASQPTISRFINALDEKAIEYFNRLPEILFEKANPPRSTKHLVLDLDSTLFETFGKQEQSAYNFHYSPCGYHPLMLFNGLNGDLMKMELRNGSIYISKNIKEFLEPIFKWLDKTYPKAQILVRADSGFATPQLYELCEEYGADFVIRLKSNATLKKYADETLHSFMDIYGSDYTKCHVMYEEFHYRAKSWKTPLRVICRVERAAGELLPRATFIATTLKAQPKVIVKTYNKRGNMENFIKEAKIDFSMDSVSHSSFMANSAKSLIKALAYSIVNMMKRTVLPKDRKSSRMLSIRADLIKIACKTATSARRIVFKLCSSSPFKETFCQIMSNIENLRLA
ncbi:Transposase DDE domain group 1 [Geosporobacter subterraneus DSM 17957]|uniref:Transposase DDE domain group 1 n=1 Tax=Geosporobacter subterraneus DSM 17957 TaxID=1121919 RepID=A0A1M6QK41_9FIRM|nr:IS1380 family transposase [Geosporobacter subterraneus]SHK20490.1 Transposase DDE domain group 1 [Geosporobacter subterraneus DSM 17957]